MHQFLECTPVPLRISLTEGIRVMCDPWFPYPSRVIGARYVCITLQYLLNIVLCPFQTAVLHEIYDLTSLSDNFELRCCDILQILHNEVLREGADPYFISLCHHLASTIETTVGDYQYYERYIRD